MQDDIVVGIVVLMTMGIPVAGPLVYLHIAHPQRAVQFYLGIEEVGTAVAPVVETGVDDLNLLPVSGCQSTGRQQAVFPYIVQQLFLLPHHRSQ